MATWELLSIDSVDENDMAYVTVKVNLDLDAAVETYVQQLGGIDASDVEGTRAKLDAYAQEYQDGVMAGRAQELAAAEEAASEVPVPDVPISDLMALTPPGE